MLMLKINMQLHTDILSYNTQYAKWLSKLFYDPTFQENIPLPQYVSTMPRLEKLYEKVFPRSELYNQHNNLKFWQLQTIFTFFNKAVLAMNMKLLIQFVGKDHKIFSENTADGDDNDGDNNDGFEMSSKKLQQLEMAGLFSSNLYLKVGTLVMLLRNIDQPGRLNNGSQLILTRIGQYNLESQLLGRDHDEELELIPQIPLTSVAKELLFIFTRKQFPVRLCFAMTINKS